MDSIEKTINDQIDKLQFYNLTVAHHGLGNSTLILTPAMPKVGISEKDSNPITGENEEFSEDGSASVDDWPENDYNPVYKNVKTKSKLITESEIKYLG